MALPSRGDREADDGRSRVRRPERPAFVPGSPADHRRGCGKGRARGAGAQVGLDPGAIPAPGSLVASIRIGISGWRYAPWRGSFYPADLPQRAELEYASRAFPTIEINGSFYSLQRPESYAQWRAQAPEGFVFSVKGGRYITHMLRLREVEQALANFFASGIFNLREKLGPILWQFPPNFRYDRDRMERFFRLLPRDTRNARSLALRRSAWMKGRVRLAIDAPRPLRHAVEVRHESFNEPSFIELLREQGIALVIAETAGQWPMAQDVTADFMYLRLHGDKELYRSGYSDRALTRWAERIGAWHAGAEPADAVKACAEPPARAPRDVYCYFDNTDVKLRAPVDARRLMHKLGVEWPGGADAATRQPGAARRRSRPVGAAQDPAVTTDPLRR